MKPTDLQILPMTVEIKAYVVRTILWLASIIIVAWPLHLARPAIGDIAYLVCSALVLGSGFWLGVAITKQMIKSSNNS